MIYASTLLPGPEGYELLDQALVKFSDTFEEPKPSILWSLHYAQRCPWTDDSNDGKASCFARASGIVTFAESTVDLAFDDGVLKDVERAWTSITGETSGFMQFEERGTGAYDDDDV